MMERSPKQYTGEKKDNSCLEETFQIWLVISLSY